MDRKGKPRYAGEDFWRASELCPRYGISRPTFIRWQAEEGFPQAMVICGHAYWRHADVLAWEARRIEKKDPTHRPAHVAPARKRATEAA